MLLFSVFVFSQMSFAKCFEFEVIIPSAAVSVNLFTRLLIRAFSDIKKPFIFSDLAVLTVNSENKKGFQRQSPAAWLT